MKGREEIGLSLMKWKPEAGYIRLVVKTGFPAAFQSCMIALGGMSVQRLVNSFGSSTMAAYVAANRVDSVAIQVIVSIGTALSVFTGQNIAKNQYDRIREALYKTLGVMVGASIFIASMVLIFRVQLMTLFLDANESGEAIGIGCTYLTIIGVAYVIAGVMQSYQNVIRGAGDVNTCMVAGLTELSGRIVFAYLLSGILGVTGIWIATPLSWSCGCVIPVIRYYSGRWKHKRLA
jgi:Na+-driven multidrug efflux pump